MFNAALRSVVPSHSETRLCPAVSRGYISGSDASTTSPKARIPRFISLDQSAMTRPSSGRMDALAAGLRPIHATAVGMIPGSARCRHGPWCPGRVSQPVRPLPAVEAPRIHRPGDSVGAWLDARSSIDFVVAARRAPRFKTSFARLPTMMKMMTLHLGYPLLCPISPSYAPCPSSTETRICRPHLPAKLKLN